MRVIAMAAAAGMAACAWAQEMVRPELHDGGVLIVVRDKAGLANASSPLHLGTNWAGWEPGNPSMRLSGRSDLRWQILLHKPASTDASIQFKFTRGTWETVEVDAAYADIENRTLPLVEASSLRAGEPAVFEFEIEHFADERGNPANAPVKPLSVEGAWKRVQVVGGAGDASGAMREAIVWFPPGYDDPANTERRYPVLYMQDGQNVFDFMAPTPGEWGADETAGRLIESGEVEPVIIVGIPHSGENRRVEYLPARGVRAGEATLDGDGDAYIDWLVREVVPRVERAVRADGSRRGVGGSSLGGLVALRAAQRHPGVFARVLAESPAIDIFGTDLGGTLFVDVSGWRARVFIGVGDAEWGEGRAEDNARWVEAAREMAGALEGVVGAGDVRLVVEPGGGHNEGAWASRLAGALEFLYPAE